MIVILAPRGPVYLTKGCNEVIRGLESGSHRKHWVNNSASPVGTPNSCPAGTKKKVEDGY